MGEAIGQVLPMAVGVALSPVPIIAVILIMTVLCVIIGVKLIGQAFGGLTV